MTDDAFFHIGYLRGLIDSWAKEQWVPTVEITDALESLDIIRQRLYADDEMIFKAKERICQER